MFRKLLVVGWIALAVLSGAPKAYAGGGPENVLLVVNPNSPESMAIANYYAWLRHVPPGNVVYLPFAPEANDVSVDGFRKKILQPLLDAIARRKLKGQIDYVVYSSDFPWRIAFAGDVKAAGGVASLPGNHAGEWPNILGNQASLTGMTYLYPRVLGGKPDYASLTANRYLRPMFLGRQTAPTMGFRGDLQFDAAGQLVKSDGEQYLLSVVLAVTQGEKRRGTTAREAMTYLARSAQADGTRPAEKVYFTLTDDVRTTERSRGFSDARAALDKLGVASEILSTDMPMREKNVLGLTSGTEAFYWNTTGSTLLAGALCDNLTSWGGDMAPDVRQTAMTEFLRHGAAGSCGTVTEPYLNAQLLAKFPSPMLHVHYARGCSMAEAFYQSVGAPYQLLIAGDPLCRPFAEIPTVRLSDLKPGQKIRGIVLLKPEAVFLSPPKPTDASRAKTKTAAPPADKLPADKPATEKPMTEKSLAEKLLAAKLPAEKPLADKLPAEKKPDAPPAEKPAEVDHFELFVDGVRSGVTKPGEHLALDTTLLGDGYHEVRVVSVGPAPIYTQSRQIVWVVVSNQARSITASANLNKIPRGAAVTISAECPVARRIEIHQNGRVLGTIKGISGTIDIPAAKLGGGPNVVQAVGFYSDRPEDQVFARPIVLGVELPPEKPTTPVPNQKPAPRRESPQP
ncbi:MAG TPA: hypothetical protein VJL29_00575 [Thermoguttaceae bacterium]|nr:hypothetical protein [Thermoguttaceae bacterium]